MYFFLVLELAKRIKVRGTAFCFYFWKLAVISASTSYRLRSSLRTDSFVGVVGRKVFTYGFVSRSEKGCLGDQEKRPASRALSQAAGGARDVRGGRHCVVYTPCL